MERYEFFETVKYMERVYRYLSDIYEGLKDVELRMTAEKKEKSRYQYKCENGKIVNQYIMINLDEYDESDDFITRYCNEEFGKKLTHEYVIYNLRTLCHEIGHYLNAEEDLDDEYDYFEALNYIDEMYESGSEEKRRAYRMIGEEYEADRISCEILREHLDRLLEL